MPEVIIKCDKNFLKITDNDIFVKAITLGFWLQGISKREGDVEVSVGFTKDSISRPYFFGDKFTSYGWNEDFSTSGIKDVCDRLTLCAHHYLS